MKQSLASESANVSNTFLLFNESSSFNIETIKMFIFIAELHIIIFDISERVKKSEN